MSECVDADVVATEKRYDNNYFYDYDRNIVVISFAGWQHLTTLPVSNGLVLMITEILVDLINLEIAIVNREVV